MDPNLKKIEGSFDEKGILNGNTVLNYFDNSRIRGSFVNGVLHGLVRLYIGKNLCQCFCMFTFIAFQGRTVINFQKTLRKIPNKGQVSWQKNAP